MSALAWAAYVIAGAAGAVTRFTVERTVRDRYAARFPWGTVVVNVTGSFLFGFLTGLGLSHGLPRTPRVILGTGFCGAYTTFSAFTFETVGLIGESRGHDAARYALGTFVAASVAAALGLSVAALQRP
jgi:fluoride exporter